MKRIRFSHGFLAGMIIFLVLFFDQFLKIWIKTHLIYGEEIHVLGNWFILHFTENNGMAFGLEFGGSTGKILLSLFRIVAVTAILWFLIKLIKEEGEKKSLGLIICISLIFAGAMGNIIDSSFYGLLFSESSNQVATFLPDGGGYAGFLHGRVVDMLYFPIIKGFYPEWIPLIGGKYFEFFRPVFNIADSAITTGVAILLLFQRSYFRENKETISSN